MLFHSNFLGSDAPHSVFRSVIGYPRHGGIDIFGNTGILIGDAALSRSEGTLHSAIEAGVITNWDHAQMLWKHAFDHELNIAMGDNSVLLTEPVDIHTPIRQKVAQIMFEDFNVPALCIRPTAMLALQGAGQVTGMVLESGAGMTQSVPVHEGQVLRQGVRKAAYGGRDITDFLVLLLKNRGYELKTRGERAIIDEMKQKLCLITEDFAVEMANGAELEPREHTNALRYELPDGQTITMGTARFVAPEALFQPSLMGSNQTPVHDTILASLAFSDQSIQPNLASNIVLSGGNTLFPGYHGRLMNEIARSAPSDLVSHASQLFLKSCSLGRH
ncbi:actin [Mycena indigotica]|uniref:Centractin n=1 Tax=Mycena indigotica TaxID=2126181 RepID=A0A8H6WHQ2_9AGAR|nr:actin [Mycena indigotica]KAF7312684.1 actin [Mycena indigotica]